jgi:hypothetical protein
VTPAALEAFSELLARYIGAMPQLNAGLEEVAAALEQLEEAVEHGLAPDAPAPLADVLGGIQDVLENDAPRARAAIDRLEQSAVRAHADELVARAHAELVAAAPSFRWTLETSAQGLDTAGTALANDGCAALTLELERSRAAATRANEGAQAILQRMQTESMALVHGIAMKVEAVGEAAGVAERQIAQDARTIDRAALDLFEAVGGPMQSIGEAHAAALKAVDELHQEHGAKVEKVRARLTDALCLAVEEAAKVAKTGIEALGRGLDQPMGQGPDTFLAELGTWACALGDVRESLERLPELSLELCRARLVSEVAMAVAEKMQ